MKRLILWLFLSAPVWAVGSTQTTPLVPHKDPQIEREFQHTYSTMANAPSVYISAGAPSGTPAKLGDIDISTTTSKIYIATATLTSGSWIVIN